MKTYLAFTEDGRRAVLLDDGTWSFDETSTLNATEGVRSVKWGMSKSQVRSSEKSPLLVDDDTLLIYETNIDDYEFRLGYFFVSDQLVQARYMLAQELNNGGQYEELGDFLRMMLLKKYGATSAHEEFWTMSGYESEPRGEAILAGALSLYTKWESKETRILLAVSGEAGAANIAIEYHSVMLSNLQNKYREETVFNQL